MKHLIINLFFPLYCESTIQDPQELQKKSENRKVAWERMSRPIRSAWESKKRNIPQYWKKKFPEAKKTTKSNNLVQAAFNVFSGMALYESKLKRDCDFWRILQMNVRMHRVLKRWTVHRRLELNFVFLQKAPVPLLKWYRNPFLNFEYAY